MGYSYDAMGRLACDYCGKTGGVRKRACPRKVTTEDGYTSHYCTPPAMCGECYSKVGGSKVIHANCAEGAARSQARYDDIRARLKAGEAQVRSAYGDWHVSVPSGLVGVCFADADSIKSYVLVPKADYDPEARHWLSDYPNAQPWIDHPGVTSKRVM